MNINIKKMRRSMQMSQSDLAEKMGCTQTNISFLEKGVRNTSREIYDRLVALFGEETVMRFNEPDIPGGNNGRDQMYMDGPNELRDMINLFKEQQRQTERLIDSLTKLTDMLLAQGQK